MQDALLFKDYCSDLPGRLKLLNARMIASTTSAYCINSLKVSSPRTCLLNLVFSIKFAFVDLEIWSQNFLVNSILDMTGRNYLFLKRVLT